MDEIRLVLCENFEYDIIAISETWLSESPQNDCRDLYLPNYTIFRKVLQTPNSRGGGVAFYVSNNIKVSPHFDLSSEKIELLWLESTTNSKTLLIGVCYRPPGQNRTDATLFVNELELSLENVKTLRSDVTVLMGDFNDKCNSWDDDHSSSELERKLYDLAKVNTYNQLIIEPTRYVGDTATLLDLIITDSPHLCYHADVSSSLANLDYCTIHCRLDISTYKTKAFKRTVWDYKATYINEINESMYSAPWDTSYALYDDIDDNISFNNSLIKSICLEHILHKTVTIRTTDKPWMSNEVCYFFRRRDSFLRNSKELSQ